MKKIAPSAERNKEPILEVLQACLPKQGRLLELAGGTGQHADYFCRKFPELLWQTSDRDPEQIVSMQAYQKESRQENFLKPLVIDIESYDFPASQYDALICCNMIHISPWSTTVALMQAAGKTLKSNALLFMYGPYFLSDVGRAKSNIEFDQYLQSRNPEWGVRTLEAVSLEAEKNLIEFEQYILMPRDNYCVLYRKS